MEFTLKYNLKALNSKILHLLNKTIKRALIYQRNKIYSNLLHNQVDPSQKVKARTTKIKINSKIKQSCLQWQLKLNSQGRS